MKSKVLVLLPCYKRPEYTQKCISALEQAQAYGPNVLFYLVDDGSGDKTGEILENAKLPKCVIKHEDNRGLRNVVIQFFEASLATNADLIVKMDNDCLVPSGWLDTLVAHLEAGHADVLSPNVLPSNAAMQYGGQEDENGIRPSKLVGGLWAMRASLLQDIFFEVVGSGGIKGAWHLLNQILVEKEPRIGWTTRVNVQDIGHWSGTHPEHIKSQEHLDYSIEVGRKVAWA